MIERNALHIKSCLGQRSAKLSRGPRDKYTNVVQHMSKTHVRANIFITLFLGRETSSGLEFIALTLQMRQ